ncbi:MAG: hypothetical protein K9H16_05975 [Bacteroidales bacterium]|nr:hypothetical protein [Bacteroidales bacterium]
MTKNQYTSIHSVTALSLFPMMNVALLESANMFALHIRQEWLNKWQNQLFKRAFVLLHSAIIIIDLISWIRLLWLLNAGSLFNMKHFRKRVKLDVLKQ